MLSALIILVAAAVSLTLAFHPQLAKSSFWRATVTPLASIMGSGFLVVAPLLHITVGRYAVPAMTSLLIIAYAVGAVIRFNIRYAEQILKQKPTTTEVLPRVHRLHAAFRRTAMLEMRMEALHISERVSHIVLAGAYFISISYYLQLLAAFVLRASGYHGTPVVAKIIVTSIIALLGLTGTIAGLRSFEKIERYVIALNLGMIAALITGLLWKNISLWSEGAWTIPDIGITGSPAHAGRVLMGMLIVVQGFETSRFLGTEHPAEERIRSMRFAQWIASGVYLVFLGLIGVMFSGKTTSGSADVTAIITIAGSIAPILATLVYVTAIGSQFTASTADDAGCAGLLEAVVVRFMPGRFVYAVVAAVAILVTWTTNVLQIISLASRAFALFYAIQCLVAVLVVLRPPSDKKSTERSLLRGALFALMGLACLAVTIFGIPAG